MMDVSTKFLENPHGFGELCGYIDDINTFAEIRGCQRNPYLWGCKRDFKFGEGIGHHRVNEREFG